MEHGRPVLRAAVLTAAAAVWVSLFWVAPARGLPIVREIGALERDLLLRGAGLSTSTYWVVHGYLWALPPIAVALRRRPCSALGLGVPGPGSLRLTLLALAASLPLVVAFALLPEVRVHYARALSAGGWSTAASRALIIPVEHALIQGALLALAVSPRGLLALKAWGSTPLVPRAALPALVGQALVFGLVHLGKSTAEIVASLAAGLALGALALATRSVWPLVGLHLATATVVVAIALARPLPPRSPSADLGRVAALVSAGARLIGGAASARCRRTAGTSRTCLTAKGFRRRSGTCLRP